VSKSSHTSPSPFAELQPLVEAERKLTSVPEGLSEPLLARIRATVEVSAVTAKQRVDARTRGRRPKHQRSLVRSLARWLVVAPDGSPSLVLPFAALGLGGTVALHTTRFAGPSSAYAWAIPCLVLGVLGGFLSQWRKYWALWATLGVLVASAAAVVSVVVVGCVASDITGPWSGLAAACETTIETAAPLVLLPSMLAMTAMAQRSQRARARSEVAASDSRAVWLVAIVAIAVNTLLIPTWATAANRVTGVLDTLQLPLGFRSLRPCQYLLGACAAAAAVLTALDLRSLTRVEMASAGFVATRRTASTAPSFDFGVGSEEQAIVAHPGSPYRDEGRTEGIIRGNADRAHRYLRRALLRGLCGAAVVVGLALVVRQRPWRSLEPCPPLPVYPTEDFSSEQRVLEEMHQLNDLTQRQIERNNQLIDERPDPANIVDNAAGGTAAKLAKQSGRSFAAPSTPR
jgi:hypothetical protein